MSTTRVSILQQANAVLRSALSRLQPERTGCSVIEAAELSDWRGEIRCAADCLRDLPASDAKDPVLEEQIAEFRCNLETLKQALPGFHSRLLAEHARLMMAHTHSVSASGWVQAHGKTL